MTAEHECTCEVLPPSMWETYGGATEPGSMVEPDPECRACFTDEDRARMWTPAPIEGQLHGGDLPDQSGRAEPFGLAYDVEDVGWPCTCDVDLFKTSDGRIIVETRMPDQDNPCPITGHDLAETTRPTITEE